MKVLECLPVTAEGVILKKVLGQGLFGTKGERGVNLGKEILVFKNFATPDSTVGPNQGVLELRWPSVGHHTFPLICVEGGMTFPKYVPVLGDNVVQTVILWMVTKTDLS